MMGDADVLIRVEQYDRIVPIMRELGFSEGEVGERNFVWTSDSLCLELHKCLIESTLVPYYNYFQNGWVHAKVKDGTRYAMDEENTFAFLFTHFSRHYSEAGIGCRHVVDLWVYLRSHPEMDEAYLRTVLEKLNLWEFYQNIRRLIAVWFEGEAPDDKSDFIAQTIFSNGSWGFSGNATLSKGVRDMEKSGSVVISRIKYIWRCLFPGIMRIRNQYPILRKQPWLLPVMWFVRLFDKLVLKRSIFRKHRRQLLLLNREKLKSRKEMLEYVGLIGDE